MEPEAGEAACALSEEERRCSANHVVYRVVRAKVRFGFGLVHVDLGKMSLTFFWIT